MKPLIILVTVFGLSLVTTRICCNGFDVSLSGRIGMSAMLLFTSAGHFLFTNGMTMMLPAFIPNKKEIVYATGIVEIAAAVGLLIPASSITTAWLLIIFFILILPANIYAAINRVDYQKGTFDGNGTSYLGFRIPLQVLFIVWVYLSAIKVGTYNLSAYFHKNQTR